MVKSSAQAFLVLALVISVVFLPGCEKQLSQEELNERLLVEAIDGNTPGVEKLVEKGADLDARDGDGKTPLHLAVENDKIMTALNLINLGADLDAKDRRGWTPLHLAAFTNNTRAASLLLDNGAGVNQLDNEGWTPLDIAADLSYQEMAKLLLERGGSSRYLQ